jgi:hypothetical protein
MHPVRGIELGRKLIYRGQTVKCSIMFCVSISEELKSPQFRECVCVRACVYRLEAALCEGGRQAVDLMEVVIN